MTYHPLHSSGRNLVRAFCLGLAIFSAQLALAAPVKFDIPAESAPAALALFIKQSGSQVMFALDELKDVQTKALAGSLEPEAGLKQMLADTGFGVTKRAENWFVVARETAKTGSVASTVLNFSTGKPVEGAKVRVVDTALMAVTDHAGRFLLSEVPVGMYSVIILADDFTPTRVTDVVVHSGKDLSLESIDLRPKKEGVAQMEEYVVSAKKDVEVMEKYVVTDKKSAPFSDLNVDIPRGVNDEQPYYIFNSTQIETSDATSVSDFLKKNLTMNTQQQGANQSGNAIGNYPSIDLHGLGTSSSAPILILVNGHRVASTASSVTSQLEPSINGIPMAAIDRIEILPTSASAIYGGSAAGGVINIILKSNYSGGEVRATYNSAPADGNSHDQSYQLSYGLSLEGGRTHVTLAATYAQTAPAWLGDLPYIKNRERYVLSLRPYTSLVSFTSTVFTTPNITSSSGNLVLKNGTSLGSNITYVPAGTAPGSSGLAAALLANAGQYNTQFSTTERGGAYTGGSQQSNLAKSLMGTFSRQMTPWLELYGDWSTNTAVEITPGVTRIANSVAVPANAPTNPFVGAVTVSMPLPATTATGPFYAQIITQSATVGLKFKLPADWKAETDYTWSAGSGYFNESLVDATALAAGVLSGAVNPFADTVASGINPDNYRRYIYEWYPPSSVNDAALRFSGPLFSLPAGKPQLTIGLEHRKEGVGNQKEYSVDPPTPASSSTIYFFGLSESTDSLYMETEIPIIGPKNSLPLVRALDLQLAGRTEAYEVGGGTTGATVTTGAAVPTTTYTPVNVAPYHTSTKYTSSNPTIALKWELTPDVTFRASVAKAFIPPTFGNLTPNTIPAATLTNVTDPNTNTTYGVSTISGGNPALTPQHSKNWDLGLIYQPTTGPLKGLRFDVEYWDVDETNVISSLSAQQIVSNASSYPGRVTRDPTSGLITLVNISSLNLYEILAQGFDTKIDYQRQTEVGTFGFSGMVTYIAHIGEQRTFGAPLLEYAGTERQNAGIGSNKLKLNATLQWSRGPWTVGWTTTYWNSYKQTGAPGDPAYAGNPNPVVNTTYLIAQGADHVAGQMYHDIFATYAFPTAKPGAKSRPFAGRLLENLTLQGGINDLFNTAPPFDANSTSFGWASPYGDPRLRRYWVSLRKGF